MDKLNYIEGLIAGDRKVIYSIYQNFLPDFTKWILKNSGSEQDAYDVFQDALESILRIVSTKEWNTDLPFGAYLFRVCRNIWISNLRKKNREDSVRLYEQERYNEKQYDEMFHSEEQEVQVKIEQMLNETFLQLSPLCQKLIPQVQEKVNAKDIAEDLNMANANTVHRRKFACFETWRKLLSKHQFFSLWEKRHP